MTKDFSATIRERAEAPAFRQALLREGLEVIYNGDSATGLAILCKYIDATIGFAELSRATKIPVRV